jgi:membrane protease YdiL (CAAX protease family)
MDKTMKKSNKLSTTFLIAFFYIGVMGAGMYIMHYLFGYSYGQPEMSYVILWVEILLSLIVISAVLKFSSWADIGFAKFKGKQLIWLSPAWLLLGFLLVKIIIAISEQGLNNTQWKLFAYILVTTLLVGFSEEVMFRGIVLNTLLKKKGVLPAVLVSALLFSALHIVNILGGSSLLAVGFQLILTFIFGVFTALIFLKIKNILPLIIFHFLWDFSLFFAPIVNIETTFMILIMLPIEIITIFILLQEHKSNNDLSHI